jgi:membrane-bound lytic murein transglycosylase MltF
MIRGLLLALIYAVGGNVNLPVFEEAEPVIPEYPYTYDVYSTWMKQEPISQYDRLLQRVGMQEGVDWRLLSAIAYHESRFRHHVVSSAGARGIMQVRPVVARHFNVPTAHITDLETNVMLAAKLLRAIEEGLDLPADTPPDDRTGLILAAYNAGEAHVATARRRARAAGHNPNSWADVAPYLGRRQTTAFVRKVTSLYSEYRDKYSIPIDANN